MLQDAYGRRFYYLRLSITDVCNFRCTYCLPNGYQGSEQVPFLSVNELHNAASAFAQMGTQKVRLTGGEPSLRTDLPDIIERVASVRGIETLALTTNGYKLPQRIGQWVNAGLTALNVSIDTLDEKAFHDITGHNRLPEILDGLQEAHALGIQVKVNSVLMRDVNDDLTATMAFLKKTPVTLRFIEVMETRDQDVFFRAHHLSGQSIEACLLKDGWQPVLRERSAGPAKEFWHPDYVGRIGLIMPYSRDFCASCNRLRISSIGKLHLCLFSEAGIDIRPLLQQPQDAPALLAAVGEFVKGKGETHQLHQHTSGALDNLSQIGG